MQFSRARIFFFFFKYTIAALYLFAVDKKQDSKSLQEINAELKGEKMTEERPLVTPACLEERGHTAEETRQNLTARRYVPKQKRLHS